jgi:hypothetical protein
MHWFELAATASEARSVASQRFTESVICDHSAKERRAVRRDELVNGG